LEVIRRREKRRRRMGWPRGQASILSRCLILILRSALRDFFGDLLAQASLFGRDHFRSPRLPERQGTL
jgi:hypothetical protein